MSIVVIGASHHSAPLEMLEKMVIDDDRLTKALDDLLGREHLSEVVVVSTCNRTEVYAVAEKFHGAYGDVRDFFAELTFLPPDAFVDGLLVEYDDDAVRHLFRVAAGLESVVIGEHEILGQVRTAWEAARVVGASGPSLNLLFRHAIEAGKRARTETNIARHVASVSQAAVVMAADRAGDLVGRRAVVVGAGDMGRGMVQMLADQGLDEIVVVNRTAARAESLLQSLRAGAPVRLAGYDRLHEELTHADVVFTSTRASSAVLTVDDIAPVVAGRAGRELVIVDIAVPRDVDPAVGDLDGVTLLDMDALADFTERGIAERRREVPAVNAIVEAEFLRHAVDASSRQVAPLVKDFHAASEALRVAELDRFAARLTDLEPEERETVEALTKALVAKLLHTPTVRLKDAAGTLRGERLATNLRDLFDL